MLPPTKPHELAFLPSDAIKKTIEKLCDALLAVVVELLPNTMSFLHQLTVDLSTSRGPQAIVSFAKCTEQTLTRILVWADIASIASMLPTELEYSWYPQKYLRQGIHVTHISTIIHTLQWQVLRARPTTT